MDDGTEKDGAEAMGRLTKLILSGLLIWVGVGESRAPSTAVPQGLDCAGNPRALWNAEPEILYQDGHEWHQVWLLRDRPDLWSDRAPEYPALERYRKRFLEEVTSSDPLALIRANRERHPWLEREHPAEGRINRQVEAGVGRHRPMTCLESAVLAYQAGRFDLFEQPSEIVAMIVRKSEPAGDQVKVYIAADDDSVPPKLTRVMDVLELDLNEGWRFHAVFHNHTFSHDEERGLLPVAAPSANDLQLSVALIERLGLEKILVTDGFQTLELSPDEVRELWRAAVGE